MLQPRWHDKKENTKKHEGCESDEYVTHGLRAFDISIYLISRLKMGKIQPWATLSRGLSAAISTGMFLFFLLLAIDVSLHTL